MRDPFSWSFPLGRIFGITVRVHLLFPLVVAGLILRVAFKKDPPNPDGYWIEACWVMGILFFSVLLHEFGHCFGARLVDGDANEVLLWPLGGLASLDVPHTPRANFIATAAGPLVNLLICLGSGSALFALSFSVTPLLSPAWDASAPELFNWAESAKYGTKYVSTDRQLSLGLVTLSRFFWVNWILLLLNCLPAFPLDMGRMLQCALWPRLGFRQATLAAVVSGFVVAIGIGVYAIAADSILFGFLCLFIYFTCRQQWIILETGAEESLFGYDFSQGYTSLERDQPPRRRRRPNFVQRWLQRRAARKHQHELEQREVEERRMDELLEKVQRVGLSALTDEERRFLTRVSAKYRNRH
jgi:Zn-dependent protease